MGCSVIFFLFINSSYNVATYKDFDIELCNTAASHKND